MHIGLACRSSFDGGHGGGAIGVVLGGNLLCATSFLKMRKKKPHLVSSLGYAVTARKSTGEINNNYLFWQITSVYRAICAHSSSPASPAQEPSSALGSSWALHQPVVLRRCVRPVCLQPCSPLCFRWMPRRCSRYSQGVVRVLWWYPLLLSWAGGSLERKTFKAQGTEAALGAY